MMRAMDSTMNQFLDELPLGELKARHRERHLCFKCYHHLVCGMAKATDPNLLVTISHCLGFEPAESDPNSDDENG